MKGLWEFIEGEKAKVPSSEKDTEQKRAALERLEQEDFSLIEYDDVIVRQIVEEIRIVDKQMISIRFLCGMGVCQNVWTRVETFERWCLFYNLTHFVIK